jgi:hypothetical protein
MGIYAIKGHHPESDSTWWVKENEEDNKAKQFDSIEEAHEFMQTLPAIDEGLGWYDLWDIVANEPVEDYPLE